MSYDGPLIPQRQESRLQKAGYVLEFCCSYCSPRPPDDFVWPKHPATGWAYRRAIVSWAKKRRLTDYRILRNTGYVKDLHGTVYECWVKE